MNDRSKHTDIERTHEQVQAYFDGQIQDSAVRKRIEDRIEEDAPLQQELKDLEAMRERLRELPKTRAPSYLRDRAISAMREGRPEPRWQWRQWYWAAAASLLVVMGAALWMPNDEAAGGMDMGVFVKDHIALVQSDQANVTSDDPSALENWFRERLDFAPALPRWNWLEPVEGQIHTIGSAKAAWISYRLGDEEVSLFVQVPEEPGRMQAMGAVSPDTAIVDEMRGYKIACWAKQGMDYILVARANAEDVFERLEQETA